MNLNHLIRSFTIRTRMLGAVFVVAASLLVVGAVGFAGQTYSNSVSMSFFSVEFASLQRIGALRTTMNELRLHEKDMLIQYESPEKFGKARDAWMKTFAAQAGATYVDLYSAVVDQDSMFRDGLSRDGVHPTPEGYAVLTPLVVSALRQAMR